MPNKKYWHEISDEEFESLYRDHKTWEFIENNYLKPFWCNDTDALFFDLGCCYLLDKDLRKNISVDYCSRCHHFKKP